MWTTSPGKLSPFNSFLILFNLAQGKCLKKDICPEQLLTIKLRNKGPRGWIN